MTKYRHFKGATYELICEALHTETEETLVIYKDESGKIYARPDDMFHEVIERDGKQIKRFTKI